MNKSNPLKVRISSARQSRCDGPSCERDERERRGKWVMYANDLSVRILV